jgi:hypothetical protein
VRDNLETLYGAIDDGALDVRLPQARQEGARGVSQLRLAVPRLHARALPGVRREPAGCFLV